MFELSGSGAGLRAVVIDDDIAVVMGLGVALSRLGVEVVGEFSSTEQMSSAGTGFISCDIVLAGAAMDGAAGLRGLTQFGYRVLALSAMARPIEVGNAIGAGALGYLDRRDFDYGELSRNVFIVAKGKRCLSRSLATNLILDLRERPLPHGVELDERAKGFLEVVSTGVDPNWVNLPMQERSAALERVWAAWSRRLSFYGLSLTQRQLQILELLDQGWNAEVIAEELNVSVGTVRGDQDRIKTLLRDAYGLDLKRDSACRKVWYLISGQLKRQIGCDHRVPAEYGVFRKVV
ncbi:MAG: helix-turn-helix transcriptional regulator [Ferrimicrobium sp.]